MTVAHAIVAPIVLPLLTGAALLLIERRSARHAWALSVVATLGFVALAAYLMTQAAGDAIGVYLLGNWAAPFGIALALDRLSALMLVLTGVVALAALLYARGDVDRRGPHFHALFQFQLMGLAGAFLTADLFNLFVFFEVLLIASYGLLLHGAGAARLRASIHYVTFNLTGSALFLIAVSMLYGLTGTLNMADLAVRISEADAANAALLQTAGLLLLVVFCVKAALLPLYFWLPDTYGAATAPVAALFAIMTKVGVYAIARVCTLMFGAEGGPAQGLAQPWLPALALGTLALAAIGVLAATRLRMLVAYLVVASAGTLLLAVSAGTTLSVAAALFYLVPSTLVAALLFLLVDRVVAARPEAGDAMKTGQWHAPRFGLGVLFVLAAVSVAGMPPLAGFLGKVQVLWALRETPYATASWIVILVSSLALVFALARAGSSLFWRADDALQPQPVPAGGAPQRGALALLTAALLGVVVLAGPLAAYTQAAAEQLHARTPYIDAVLGAQPVAPLWDIRADMEKP